MLDSTNRKILNILQRDCKTSTRAIGEEVGLTAPAVSERITRMKEAGIIRGYHADIDESALGCTISAFIKINVPPRSYDAFCRFCEEEPAIVEHHHIIGPENALLRVRLSSSLELGELLEKLRHYGLSNTSVLLSTYFTHKDFSSEEEENHHE